MGLSTERLDIRKNILGKVQDIAARHLKDANVSNLVKEYNKNR